jgi:hypothetical protein
MGTIRSRSNWPAVLSSAPREARNVAGRLIHGLPLKGGNGIVAQSPPYLHPFVCFVCRRSFKRSAVDRDEATCPVCRSKTVRLSRKFKPPPQSDVKQWAKVEALVELGFRFETIHDGHGGIVRYPSTERGIPAFVAEVALLEDAIESTRLSRTRRQRMKRQARKTRLAKSVKASKRRRVEFCCRDMHEHLEHRCEKHIDPADCPDSVIGRFGAEYGLRVHDGGSSYIRIQFCPWCGVRLDP